MFKKTETPPVKQNTTNKTVEKTIKTPSSSVLTASLHESFSGPVPHPDLLKRYDDYRPGLGAELVDMAKNEQKKRFEVIDREEKQKERVIEIAEKESNQAINAQKAGQRVGLAISIACTCFAMYLATTDADWKIIALFIAIPSASLIYGFSSSKKSKE